VKNLVAIERMREMQTYPDFQIAFTNIFWNEKNEGKFYKVLQIKNENEYLCFVALNSVLLSIKDLKFLYIGATFNILPNQHILIQLATDVKYTVTEKEEIVECERTVILAEAIAPNQTTNSYASILRMLKESVQEKTDVKKWPGPTVVRMDFEQALLKAVEQVFPGSYQSCCEFHLSRNLYINGGSKDPNERGTP
jgi:hypothetical protein